MAALTLADYLDDLKKVTLTTMPDAYKQLAVVLNQHGPEETNPKYQDLLRHIIGLQMQGGGTVTGITAEEAARQAKAAAAEAEAKAKAEAADKEVKANVAAAAAKVAAEAKVAEAKAAADKLAAINAERLKKGQRPLLSSEYVEDVDLSDLDGF